MRQKGSRQCSEAAVPSWSLAELTGQGCDAGGDAALAPGMGSWAAQRPVHDVVRMIAFLQPVEAEPLRGRQAGGGTTCNLAHQAGGSSLCCEESKT